MTLTEILNKFVESLKSDFRSTRYKTAVGDWLRGIVQYGAINWGSGREDLRSKALWFSLSRRELADLVNAYVAASDPRRITNHSSEAVVCGRCTHLTWYQDLMGVEDGTEQRLVCSLCVGNYYRICGHCGRYKLRVEGTQNLFVAVQSAEICSTCFEMERQAGTYNQCEHCQRWYGRVAGYLFRYNDAGEDDPDGTHLFCITCQTPERSRCKPKAPEFEFPALCLGEGQTIHSGELKEITIGGGDVAAQGMRTIYETILNKTKGRGTHGVSVMALVDPSQFNTDWQTKEGNMPKRIAKILLTEHHLKLTDELMAELGNIAKAYTTKPSVQRIRLDRIIGRDRHEYVNGDSCWWTNYWYSRCTLKSLGGMSVRCYNGEANSAVQATARGWLIPLRWDHNYGWKPQPDLTKADGYVVFNVYDREGRLEAMHFGRMVAQMTGKSYKRVALGVHNMYVNGVDRNTRAGYSGSVLIAEQSLCDQTASIMVNSIPGRCACGVPA